MRSRKVEYNFVNGQAEDAIREPMFSDVDIMDFEEIFAEEVRMPNTLYRYYATDCIFGSSYPRYPITAEDALRKIDEASEEMVKALNAYRRLFTILSKMKPTELMEYAEPYTDFDKSL